MPKIFTPKLVRVDSQNPFSFSFSFSFSFPFPFFDQARTWFFFLRNGGVQSSLHTPRLFHRLPPTSHKHRWLTLPMLRQIRRNHQVFSSTISLHLDTISFQQNTWYINLKPSNSSLFFSFQNNQEHPHFEKPLFYIPI